MYPIGFGIDMAWEAGRISLKVIKGIKNGKQEQVQNKKLSNEAK
jgi:hypothetical protein